MGISNVDALIAGALPPLNWSKAAFTGQAAGLWHSPLYVAGLPGAGSLPSAGVNGAAVSNGRTGTLAAPTLVALKSSFLKVADFLAVANVAAAQLVDRVWENSGLNVTINTLQSITPNAAAARDQNGSSNGVGYEIALEVTATIGAVSTTATVTYTDSDGNGGATSVVTIPSGAVTGTLLPFQLAAGDYGCRFPTGFQLGASIVSGSISLVMFRRLGRQLKPGSAGIPDGFGPADGGAPVPDGCAPYFIYLLSGTAVGLSTGSVQFAQA